MFKTFVKIFHLIFQAAVVVGAEVDIMMIDVLEEILQVQEPTTGWSSKICHLVLLGRV